MMGSKVLVNVLDKPRKNPIGVPMISASTYPLATSTSEYQVNRRMPWSISPRLAKGCMMYSLLVIQVLAGDGKSFAQVEAQICQSSSTTPMPIIGSTSQSNLNLISFMVENVQWFVA